MHFIYSNDEVDGISGAYIAPHYFDGVEPNAEKVYASDKKIIKAYEEVGVEVVILDVPKELSKEDKKFNALIVKLDSLSDKEIGFCAKHLGFEFTTKDETIAKINEFLGKKEGE